MAGPPWHGESLRFIANEIDGVVNEQLRAADGLDVKAGGVLALSVGTAFGYLAIVAPVFARLTFLVVTLGALAFAYGLGAALTAFAALRVRGYQRWPNPPEYAKLVEPTKLPHVADLARQAAAEKARTYERNLPVVDRKAQLVGRSLALATAEVAAALLSALLALTI